MTPSFKTTEPDNIENGKALQPKFNSDGLITAIVQDIASKEILMLAHMNAEALSKTVETGQSHFWSRSRQELWHKGATSGDIQHVREIRIDCDQDAVILRVELAGKGACHTGAFSCFYRTIEADDGVLYLVNDGEK